MSVVRRAALVSSGALAIGATLLWNGGLPRSPSDFVSRAEARVGRPLTPMSYAGVARRTTRRAAAVGAAGAAAAGTYYYTAPGTGCVQVVNPYGQLVWRCP
jgi:hypothetical protein